MTISVQPFADLRPRQLRDKLAFLVTTRDLLHHYGPVLACLDPQLVDLIVFDPDGMGLLEDVRRLPNACFDSEELLAQRIGYSVLVSNHLQCMRQVADENDPSGEKLVCAYMIRMLGLCNVRFMYGLGTDSWNFHIVNQVYDLFLCHGPLQAARMAGFRGRRLKMGYPRYDAFFNQDFDAGFWLRQFGCDPAKPVLVWFSTLRTFYGVLDRFAEAVSSLMPDYNVLVKPHPASWKGELEYVTQALDGLSFTSILTEAVDNLVLFRLADYVLSDYGGTAFSAVYTDCNLLLLDHPDYPGQITGDPLTSDSDQWLRRSIPHLGQRETEQLPGMLADQSLWEEQRQLRAELRAQLFFDNYGHSAPYTAQLLTELLPVAAEIEAETPPWLSEVLEKLVLDVQAGFENSLLAKPL